MEQNRCDIDDIYAFDKLPLENKIMFSSKKLPPLESNVFISRYAQMEKVGNPYNDGHIFYKYLVQRLKHSKLK